MSANIWLMFSLFGPRTRKKVITVVQKERYYLSHPKPIESFPRGRKKKEIRGSCRLHTFISSTSHLNWSLKCGFKLTDWTRDLSHFVIFNNKVLPEGRIVPLDHKTFFCCWILCCLFDCITVVWMRELSGVTWVVCCWKRKGRTRAEGTMQILGFWAGLGPWDW